MNEHTHPFDRTLADRAGVPAYINKETFPEIRVLNRDAFRKNKGFDPAVSSIFVVTNGGSVSTGDDRFDTYNGTLCYAPGWQEYEKLFLENTPCQNAKSHDDATWRRIQVIPFPDKN